MRQVDEHEAGGSYGDAIPGGGWSCRQTYLRNHLSIDVALRSLSLMRGDSQKPLRILDIGGGIIEPLLLAALVRARFPGVPSTIHLVDPSEDVITLLQAIRDGSRWERDWHGQVMVGFDRAAGVLPLGRSARSSRQRRFVSARWATGASRGSLRISISPKRRYASG